MEQIVSELEVSHLHGSKSKTDEDQKSMDQNLSGFQRSKKKNEAKGESEEK